MTTTGTHAPVLPRLHVGEYESRLAAPRGEMRHHDLATVVLAGPESIYHLLGLDHLGYFALTLLVVPLEGQPLVVARTMEQHTPRAQVPHARHAAYADGQDPADLAARTLAGLVAKDARVGIEEQSMFLPPAVLRRLYAKTPGLRWTDCSQLPVELRTVKSAGGIERVRAAARVSDAAMRTALTATAPGVNERTVAARTHEAMIEAGGEPPGFVPLIRSAARIAQEHVTSSDHVLGGGEALFIELSGCVQRHHAPMSRVVYCGEAPPAARVASAAARAGLEAARAALVPGVATRTVYSAWEDAVGRATGVPQCRHHCGYRTGMVFHLMSWVTEPVAHVVSDTALVTEYGCELLTDAPRDLLIAPDPS